MDRLSFFDRVKQLHLAMPPSWPPLVKHITTVLFTFAVDDGSGIFASEATLARHAGESDRQVRRVLKFLRDGGFLEDDGWHEHGSAQRTRSRRLVTEAIARAADLDSPAPPLDESDRPDLDRFDRANPDNLAPPPAETVQVRADRSVQNRDIDEPPRREPPRRTRPAARQTDEQFAAFWAAYPRKDAKADALKAWNAAVRTADPAEIVAGLMRYPFNPDPKFQKLPAGWLRDERWRGLELTPPPRSEAAQPSGSAPPPQVGPPSLPPELPWRWTDFNGKVHHTKPPAWDLT